MWGLPLDLFTIFDFVLEAIPLESESFSPQKVVRTFSLSDVVRGTKQISEQEIAGEMFCL